MESLATLVLVLLLIVLLSGPINISLTSRRIQIITSRHRGMTTVRRILILFIGVIGIFVSLNFITEIDTLGPKIFALISIGGNLYAFRREIPFNKSR